MRQTPVGLAAVFAAVLILPHAAPSASAASADKLKLGEAVESLKFGGDLRLRHEYFHRRGAGQTDRSRGRFRLRFGAQAELPHQFDLNLRLASGTGEQGSTNQSADNLGSQKAIWIDQVFLRWRPKLHENGSVYLQGGRMRNNLWRPYSADLIWDDDFNPEGVAQGAEWKLPEAGLSVFFNGLQMVADEDSNTPRNQWLFSQQLGFEKKLPRASKLRLAAAYHKWSDEQRSSFGQVSIHNGNRRTANTTAGILVNRFGVGELTGELSSKLAGTPLAVSATLARNFRARGDLATVPAVCPAAQTCPPARDGYQLGLIAGKAKDAKTWELAYFKKYAETDVTPADVSDSDFGDGGTNRKGHIFWAAYSPTGWMQLKAKYFVTETIDTQFAPGDKAVNRLQLDVSVRF